MVYRLIRTQTALSELDRIISYISIKLANPFAAEALLDDVEAAVDSLRDTPKIFVPVATPYLAEAGYRKAFIKYYVMVYKVDDETRTVYIMHFFHASQDYERYL